MKYHRTNWYKVTAVIRYSITSLTHPPPEILATGLNYIEPERTFTLASLHVDSWAPSLSRCIELMRTRCFRTEVDSLNTRVQRLNAENDDLLQRLGEAKRLKEQRERKFDEEKSQLAKRIRELEVMLKNWDENAQEIKDRVENERKEHQVNQKVRISASVIHFLALHLMMSIDVNQISQ